MARPKGKRFRKSVFVNLTQDQFDFVDRNCGEMGYSAFLRLILNAFIEKRL